MWMVSSRMSIEAAEAPISRNRLRGPNLGVEVSQARTLCLSGYNGHVQVGLIKL